MTIKIEVNEVEDKPGDGDDKPLQRGTLQVVVKQQIESDNFFHDPERENCGHPGPDDVSTSITSTSTSTSTTSTSKASKTKPKSYNKSRSQMTPDELENARTFERNRRKKLRQEKLKVKPEEIKVKVKLRDRLTPEEWRERRRAIRKKHYEKLMTTPESREAWYQFRRQYLREQRQKKKQENLKKQAEGRSQEKVKGEGSERSSSTTRLADEEKRMRSTFQQMVYRINKSTSEEWKENERQR